MTNSKLLLAAVCAAALSLSASAANWTITDGVASVTAECELSADDQTTLDGLTSISIASGIRLYAKSGDTVTIHARSMVQESIRLAKPAPARSSLQVRLTPPFQKPPTSRFTAL